MKMQLPSHHFWSICISSQVSISEFLLNRLLIVISWSHFHFLHNIALAYQHELVLFLWVKPRLPVFPSLTLIWPFSSSRFESVLSPWAVNYRAAPAHISLMSASWMAAYNRLAAALCFPRHLCDRLASRRLAQPLVRLTLWGPEGCLFPQRWSCRPNSGYLYFANLTRDS